MCRAHEYSALLTHRGGMARLIDLGSAHLVAGVSAASNGYLVMAHGDVSKPTVGRSQPAVSYAHHAPTLRPT
jgi:hypothetical protein